MSTGIGAANRGTSTREAQPPSSLSPANVLAAEGNHFSVTGLLVELPNAAHAVVMRWYVKR